MLGDVKDSSREELAGWMITRLRNSTGGLHALAGGAAIILALLFYADTQQTVVLYWGLFLVLCQVALEGGRRLFSATRDWLRAYGVLHLLTCVGWGLMPLLFFDSLAEPYQNIYAIVLAAVGIGSLEALSYAPRLYIARTVLLLTPIAVYELMTALDTPWSVSTGLFLFLVATMLLLSHRSLKLYRQYCHDATEGLSMQHAHQLLAEKQSALNEAEDRMRMARDWDPVTGLHSREGLDKNLKKSRAARQAGGIATCLKLAGFKYVNTAFGHETGNEVLVEVASRLVRLTGDNDLVCRTSGGEFLAYLPRPPVGLEGKLNELLETACLTTRGRIPVRAHIGVGVLSEGDDPVEALQCAVSAARQVREVPGRDLVVLHTADLRDHKDQSRMQFEISDALENNEFRLVYQPQQYKFGEVAGFEALLRWDSSIFGQVSPGVFIPIAEEAALINKLGGWVLEQAIHEFQQFTGHESLTLSINVSLAQLETDHFRHLVARCLADHQMNPEQLVLEITESTFMAAPKEIKKQLVALRETGVKIALDDFGTGYSSLSYLTQIPLDHLKIDRSLIIHVDDDPVSRSLVESILGICRTLDLQAVIEGLEEQEQLDALASFPELLFQGFLFSRPLPLDEAVKYATGHRRPASR